MRFASRLWLCHFPVIVVDADGGGGGWLEAEVDVEHVEETAEEQARADDEHAGEGNFGDDEDGTEALVFAAVAHSGAGVFEGFLELAPDILMPGSRPKRMAEPTVMRRVHAMAWPSIRMLREVGARWSPGGRDRRRARRRGRGRVAAPMVERTRLSVRSWRTRRARVRAERAAQSELFAARGGAGKQKVGEVDADDEKDESDGAPEDDQRAAKLTADVVLQLNGVGGVVVVGGWDLLAPVESGKKIPWLRSGIGRW